jgi:hypothetical protein
MSTVLAEQPFKVASHERRPQLAPYHGHQCGSPIAGLLPLRSCVVFRRHFAEDVVGLAVDQSGETLL